MALEASHFQRIDLLVTLGTSITSGQVPGRNLGTWINVQSSADGVRPLAGKAKQPDAINVGCRRFRA